MSTPIVTNDGLVIVGSGKDGFLKPYDYTSQTWGRPEGDDVYAFAARDGKLMWKFHTDGQNMPSPALVDDSLIFANGDAHAYALDVKSGQLRWKADLPGVATMASTTVHDGKAFISVCHNAPYTCETRALDVASGRTIWTNPHGGSDCTPAVDGGMVFVNGTSAENKPYNPGGRDTVAGIDERTGKTKWTHRFEAGPFTYIASAERQIAGTAVDGVLYQPIGNLQRVVAFNQRTGKVLWSTDTSANVKMSPLVKGDRVYFGDTAGVFYSLDRRTGRILHTTSFLQPFSVSSPVIDGDTMLVANGSIVVAMPVEGL
jgi:outer membrane protein assembly factor BamB